MNGVFVRSYTLPPVRSEEVLRYAGCRGTDGRIFDLLEACIAESETAFVGRVCYRVFEKSECLKFLGEYANGKLVQGRTSDAKYCVTFAATVGAEADRLVQRYENLAPSKALLMQAIGAERIESLCDLFEKDVEKEWAERGFSSGSRFSAGYADFPLQAQERFFEVLDCPRKIGLSLNETLLMSPTKSVTAMITIR